MKTLTRGQATWAKGARKRKYIYLLRDPRDGSPKYVGQTVNPKKRVSVLMTSPKYGNVGRWIEELKALGMRPEIEVLGSAVGFTKALVLEDKFIAKFSKTHALLNLARYRDYLPDTPQTLAEKVLGLNPEGQEEFWRVLNGRKPGRKK